MEEYIKLVEQILYMENFGMTITEDLKDKLLSMFKIYGFNMIEKYQSDLKRLISKYGK